MNASLIDWLAANDPNLLKGLTEAEADELWHDWRAWARPEQTAPDGDWQVWAYIAGRGSGKTRSGAEWIREKVKGGSSRIALIAPTAADVRDVMVEGESGILNVCWAGDRDHRGAITGRPIYEPSKRRLTWANGAVATAFSADEPDRLRGPQFDTGWCDELAAWNYAQEAWDMFMFGLRLGESPQAMVTTTPRPIPLVRQIVGASTTVVTRGSTFANRANLAASYLDKIVTRYQGTRLGRQELDGEILDDFPGALWTRAMIDDALKDAAPPNMQRIVVAIDPSGTGGDDEGDSIGIVVAGKGVDGRAYVLADRTCKLSPDGWGRRAVAAYHEFGADRIVAERNYGGAMVEHVIRTVDRRVPYREVTASRGKILRAEPIAALYEQGKVKHVAGLRDLEDQMCAMTSEGFMGDASPDRVDALVWALTELMVTGKGPATVIKQSTFGAR
ncbi:DNA-packaging protein [Brevundimonas vesicularis]|uniref:DNA-packaging protein n=1 Tax=Brevundimonas vesicularis TaxID=41276 RepID=UPI00384F4AB0